MLFFSALAVSSAATFLFMCVSLLSLPPPAPDTKILSFFRSTVCIRDKGMDQGHLGRLSNASANTTIKPFAPVECNTEPRELVAGGVGMCIPGCLV